jgi:hypothetical protein
MLKVVSCKLGFLKSKKFQEQGGHLPLSGRLHSPHPLQQVVAMESHPNIKGKGNHAHGTSN